MYTPLGDDTSVQRADPIMNTSKISPHVHQIFGSNAFAPSITYDSLQVANCTTVADASNNGNAEDNSIYWHPALYMETSNGTGYLRVPTNGHKIYYRNAGTGTQRQPFEFPRGFRMVAGNPYLRAPPANLQQQNIIQWICHSDTMNQGTAGGFPTGVTNCANVDGFNGAIHFPHCWNGQDFNPEQPTAHVVYPDGDVQEGTCPSSHPTRLPHIFVENVFDLDIVHDQVKPDSFVLSTGDPTGYGWHADFFNGWKDGAIPALLEQCPQGFYGNEDIGLCPNFEKRETPASECKLPTSFEENVTLPGMNLPGCNPISDKNPAPVYAAVPLGSYTVDCQSDVSEAGIQMSDNFVAALANGQDSSNANSTTVSRAAGLYAQPSTSHAHSNVISMDAMISCPESNNTMHTLNGMTFRVECGIDHVGGDLHRTTVNTLQECISACTITNGCVDISMLGVACYMKSTVSEKVFDAGVNSAKLMGGHHARKRS